MRVEIPRFKGAVPLVDSRLLPVDVANEAENCRFETGNLEPYNSLLAESPLIEANSQSIYLYDSTHWFSWDTDVDVILSPTVDDDYNTVIWTGDAGYPRIGYNLSVTGNATPPNVSYQLGVPAPTTAPAITDITNNAQDDSDVANDESRFYVYTFVSSAGEEGPPSPVSEEITVLNVNAIVELSFSLAGIGNHDVEQIRIYRSGTTLESSDFFLVNTIPKASLTYSDNNPTVQALTLSTIDYDPPPVELKGITMMPNGIAVGFFGKNLCFSEAYLPYAWPVGYRQTTEHEIVGIAVTGNTVIVTTEGNPYIFSGVAPDAISGSKIEAKQACVSKRSVVDMGDFVLYASPDGLVAASSSSVPVVVTEDIIRRDQWRSRYLPSTIHACYFENKYIAFYNEAAGFIFDPQTKTLIDLDFYADACYNDLIEDKLYLAINGSLFSWDSGATSLTMRWKKRFDINSRAIPSCARIESNDLASVTFALYVDGVQVHTITPPSETFRLPAIRGDYFEIEVSGTSVVRRIVLADSMGEL